MEFEGIIIVLGSPNDEHGNLSRMALARANAAIAVFQKNPNYKLLLTGGYGPGFNKTSKPHAFYLKKYLLSKRIAEDNILDFAESAYTADDAFKALEIVQKYNVQKLIIVSSDFHMPRVRYIFKAIFQSYQLSFVAAPYLQECREIEQKQLIEHEKKNLAKLKDEKWLESIEKS